MLSWGMMGMMCVYPLKEVLTSAVYSSFLTFRWAMMEWSCIYEDTYFFVDFHQLLTRYSQTSHAGEVFP